MRGKYYKSNKTSAVINIVGMIDGDIPFDNQDDLIVQYNKEKGLLIMKQMKMVEL